MSDSKKIDRDKPIEPSYYGKTVSKPITKSAMYSQQSMFMRSLIKQK